MAQKEQISTPVHESNNGISFLMAGAGGGGGVVRQPTEIADQSL